MRIEKPRSTNKKSGIGLLELMLSLSVIAIILLLAVRYYESTKRSQLVGQTMQQIAAVRAAASEWRATHRDYAGMGFDALRDRGYLPSEFGATGSGPPKHAFGGNITMTRGAPATDEHAFYQIILASLPELPCKAISDRFEGMPKVSLGDNTDCTVGTLEIKFED